MDEFFSSDFSPRFMRLFWDLLDKCTRFFQVILPRGNICEILKFINGETFLLAPKSIGA